MTELFIICVSLCFSALFSGLEIAYFSSNKLKNEIDAKKGHVSAHIISFFLTRPNLFITSLLIGNNIALVIYGIMTAVLLEPVLELYISADALIILIQTIISSIVIIFTAEFLPKAVFRIYANTALNTFAIPMLLLYIVLYPITIISNVISRVFLFFAGIKKNDLRKIKEFGKIDLMHFLLNNSAESKPSMQDKNNFKIFLNALEFSSVKLRECVRPRNQLVTAHIDDTIDDVTPKFVESGYSKIPIYKESIDNIIGYIHSSDILKNPESISAILRQIPYVPETMGAKKLLSQFINKQQSIAVVVDEFGGTKGIVTVEDIIEEIFGEIQDEHDYEKLEERKINDAEYIFSGRLEIDYINEKYNLNIPISEEYETIAGFFLDYYTHFPAVNAVITIGDIQLTIIKITGTRIELIHVKILEE